MPDCETDLNNAVIDLSDSPLTGSKPTKYSVRAFKLMVDALIKEVDPRDGLPLSSQFSALKHPSVKKALQHFLPRAGVGNNGTKWTKEEEIAMAELWSAGHTLDAIGAALQRTETAVFCHLAQLGLIDRSFIGGLTQADLTSA